MKPRLKTLALLILLFLPKVSPLLAQAVDECASTKYFFNLYTNVDAQPFPAELAACDDGGVIIVGHVSKPGSTDVFDAFFSKIDKNGITSWMKLLKAGGNERLYSVTRLSDGNYAAFGTYGEMNEGLVFLKFDVQGNIIWKKEYQSDKGLELTGSGRIREDKDGTLIVVSNFSEDNLSFNNRILFLKISSAGDLMISKFYHPAGLSLIGTGDCVIKDGSTYIIGSTFGVNLPEGLIMKIGNTDGELSWVKSYDLNAGSAQLSRIFDFGNNTFCVTGFDTKDFICFIDTAGNCSAANHFDFPFISNSAVMSENHELFWTHGLNLGVHTFSMVRYNPASNLATHYQMDKVIDPTHMNALCNLDGNLFFTGFANNLADGNYHLFLTKLSPVAESGCATSVGNVAVDKATQKTTQLNWTTRTKVYSLFNPGIAIEPAATITIDSLCTTTVQNNCSTVKIQIAQNGCTIADTVKLLANKSPGCTSPIIWSFDRANATFINQANDSSLTVLYGKPWQGYIYAEIKNACNSVKDSVFVRLTDKPEAFSLGADTSICAGEKIVLHAPGNYTHYLWQDGSTDSTYTVVQPGVYWVQAIGDCQLFSDSIVIVSPGLLLFDLGPDTTICPRDTILITAPAGFTNYNWSTRYRMMNVNAATALLFPDKDTTYYLYAKNQACTVVDSIRIHLREVAKINLGADTSFCEGDSIVLHAGTGFVGYAWNNGGRNPTITIYNKGIYGVNAKDKNGCVVADSIEIVALYSKPVIHLPEDGFICSNSNLLLNAGSGAVSYLWSTGATTSNINVNAIGTYWLRVTDDHHCSASDTVVVNAIKDGPNNFLPNDASICNYATVLIQPQSSFKSYQWNTGATTAALEIKKEGVYWVRVTDQYNCAGVDSITISLKQCIDGFNIPSSFTPNGDGLNDIFRPLIGGNVSNYHFRIYNRFGEMIFESRTFSQGWNGTFRGIKQASNAFVWHCQFQLNNGPVIMKKGTVVLLN